MAPTAKLAPIVSVVLTGCSGDSGAGLARTSESTITPKTATVAIVETTRAETTTTTVPPYMEAGAWFNDSLMPVLDQYNARFAERFQQLLDEGEFQEARLECVAVGPLVDTWEEEAGTPPDPVMEALTVDAFEQLRSASGPMH